MSDTAVVRRHDHLMPPPVKVKVQKQRDCFRKYDLPTIILLFFIFSFIGWCWEVGLHIVKDHAFINRGTMYGPWLPIYGTGGVLIILLLKKLFRNPVATFFATVVVCGIVEYFTSWYLEVTKHIKWWDYSGKFLNLDGRICAEGLLVFGLGGCAIIYIGAPFFAEQLDKLKTLLKITLCVVLVTVFSMDFVYAREHPNTGKGITDYGENETGSRSEGGTWLPSDLIRQWSHRDRA